jgi:hypothetical protein
MARFNTKRILIGLAIVLVLIQLIRIDKTNPSAVDTEDFIMATQANDEVAAILKNACYDCHSHHTKYPWYADVAPVSWLLRSHIKEGRQHLNFSTWTTYDVKKQNHKLEECVEVIENGSMPMKSYTWTHSAAKLSADQKNKLTAFFASLGK